jgi:hypothetical protein
MRGYSRRHSWLDLAQAIGLGWLWAIALLLTFTFFRAIYSGGQVLVTVNQYGEKWAEIILLPIALVLGAWAIYRSLKR